MFKRLCVLAILAAAVLPALADDKPAEKIRVILIDGQNNHNWRATTPLMKKELESCGRFRVDVASKLSAKDQAKGASPTANVPFPPDLGTYDVLVSNYNGAPWPKEFQKDLEDRLREGKIGLVIIHAANNSFENWSEYNRMIGMGWRNNKFGDRLTLDADGKEMRVPKGKGPGAGHGPYHPFLVTVRDTEHPITRGMPREWMHAGDELYHGMRGPVENVHLLATAYDDKKQRGTGTDDVDGGLRQRPRFPYADGPRRSLDAMPGFRSYATARQRMGSDGPSQRAAARKLPYGGQDKFLAGEIGQPNDAKGW